jgi:uncharacterized protein HemY
MLVACHAVAAQEPGPAGGGGGKPTPEIQNAAAEVVDQLQAAARAGDVARTAGLLDAGWMQAEVRRQEITDLPLDAETEAFLRTSAARRLVNAAAAEQWQGAKVQRVMAQEGGLLCVIQIAGPTGAVRKLLWLNQSQGSWRVGDWQDLRDVFRASTELGGLWSAMNGAVGVRGFLDLLAASRMPAAEPAAALTMLAQLDNAELPPILQAARWMLAANASASLGEIGAALGALERAEASGGTSPARLFLMARIHAAAGDPERGRVYANQALDLLGEDAALYRILAQALERLGKPADAAVAVRSALAIEPNSMSDVARLASLLPRDSKAELTAVLERVTEPAVRLPQLASDLVAQADSAALRIVAGQLRKVAPAGPLADYYLATAARLETRHDEAADALRQAITKAADAEQRALFAEQLIAELIAAGRPLEAYQQAPAPAYAFQRVAEELLQAKDAASLEQLIEQHRKAAGQDPWLPYYSARLALLQKRYGDAKQQVSEAIKANPGDLVRERLDEVLLEARFLLGEGLESYRESSGKESAFQQLAALASAAGQAEFLLQLIDHHRKFAGADANELDQRASEALLLKQDYAGAAQLLQQLIAKTDDPELQTEHTLGMIEAWLKAGQPLEAYRRAPDKLLALRVVADALAERRESATLETLLQEHAKQFPDDSALPYYEGRLLLLRERYKEAVETLAKAAETAGDDERLVELVRQQRVFALYKAGRATEAYQKIEPQQDVFGQLVLLLGENGELEALKGLLDLRRTTQPEDPTLIRADAELLWREQKYAALTELLQKYADSVFRDGEPHSYWEGRMIRSLARLGQFDQALSIAQQSTSRDGDSWYEAVVWARRGDVDRTAMLLEAAARMGYDAAKIYLDPDLNEMLRTDKFAALRTKYPIPAESK